MKKIVLSLVSIVCLFSLVGCQYIVTPGPVQSVKNKRAFKIKSVNPKTQIVTTTTWVPPYNIERDKIRDVRSECLRKSQRKALGRITVLDESLFRYPNKTNREKFRHEHLKKRIHSRENKYKLTRQYEAQCLKKLGFRKLSEK